MLIFSLILDSSLHVELPGRYHCLPRSFNLIYSIFRLNNVSPPGLLPSAVSDISLSPAFELKPMGAVKHDFLLCAVAAMATDDFCE